MQISRLTIKDRIFIGKQLFQFFPNNWFQIKKKTTTIPKRKFTSDSSKSL